MNASNWLWIALQITDAVDFDTVASGPRVSASAASMSRIDSPRTQPEITSASNALVRVTPLPSSWEENASRVPRTLGRLSATAPAVVLTWMSP